VEIAGGKYISGDSESYDTITPEQLLAWNPDVIFIWGNAKYSARDIMSSPQWQHVKAVRNRQVYKAPEWSTWSPRLAPVSLWMAMKLYPERYQGINLYSVADSFDRKVFGVPLGTAGAGAF